MTRKYHLIDYENMKNSIANDPRTNQILLANNTNQIAQNLVYIIIEELDKRAPQKKIQWKGKV